MNILVLIDFNPVQKERVMAKAPNAQWVFSNPREATKEQIEAADIILGNPRARDVAGSKKLKFLQVETAGADFYTKEGILSEGVTLCSCTGAYGPAVAEHMLAMVLSLYKKLHLYRDHQNRCEWADEGEVKSIVGARVLILGLGDIGSHFAMLMKALGAYTIGVRRTGTDKPEVLDELYLMDDLDGLLPTADIVVMVLPSTPDTYQLMNEERLRKLKSDAVLINGGRGNTVDTEALYRVMASGHLLGVGLEVTDPEPLPKEHPLWQVPNLLLTPHISGWHHLPETVERISQICAHNLEAFLTGGELKSIIDPSTGYRKLQK